MAERINVRSGDRRMSFFQKVPWTLAIIAYMVVVHFTALRNLGLGVSA